jgi:hypothetical protein
VSERARLKRLDESVVKTYEIMFKTIFADSTETSVLGDHEAIQRDKTFFIWIFEVFRFFFGFATFLFGFPVFPILNVHLWYLTMFKLTYSVFLSFSQPARRLLSHKSS